MRAALLHVMSDLLGSVAAIVAALVILQTGWTPIDPILSIVITLLILRSAWLITKDAGHILLEGAPSGLDVREVQKDLEANVPDVQSVHHVHAWSLSENRRVMTLHALTCDTVPPEQVAAAIKARLKQAFGVVHATVEVEHSDCADARGAKGVRQGVDASAALAAVLLTDLFKFVATNGAMTDHLSPATPGDARPRVMIADKSPVVRAGLRDFIARDGRFEVLDAHASGAAFIAAVEQYPTDIGIIGWSLPDMTGGEVLATLKRRHIPTRIVVYTGEPGKDVLRQAVRLGAWGFISKSDEPSVLVDTIAVGRARAHVAALHRPAGAEHRSVRRADLARARAAHGARQRLDELADRVAHRHLAQHRQVSPQEPLR